MNSYKILTKKRPEKRLLLSLRNKAGRGSSGRITVRHQGGGVKRLYRIVDFGEEKKGIPARVVALEYDPYRTGFIALLEYQDGEKRYILAPQNLKVGDEVLIAEKTELKLGNRMQLKNIPVGTEIHNIELIPGRGGKLAKGAGTSASVLAQENGFTQIVLPSSEVRKIFGECFATVGTVSRSEWKYTKIGKAGRSRLRGIRPTVRGSAMSAYAHPHGGGEGKAPIGLKHPKTPWGKPALGVKTRKRKRTDKYILQRRKK